MGTNALDLIGPAPIAPQAAKILSQMAAAEALAVALDVIGDKVAGYFGDKSLAEIPTTPPIDLINNIEFKPTIEVSNDNITKLGAASEVISSTQADQLALLNKLKADAEALHQNTAANMEGYDQIQAEAAAKVMRNTADARDALPPAADVKAKKLKRKPTDRVYVSAEYHEWVHNTTELERVSGSGPKPIDLWAAAGDGTVDATHPTYGEWIDAKEFRKAGELYRKLVRATKGPGAKQRLESAGTTQAALLATLIADPANKAIFVAAVNNTPWLSPD